MDIIDFFFLAIMIFIIMLLIGLIVAKIKDDNQNLGCGAIGTFESADDNDIYNHF